MLLEIVYLDVRSLLSLGDIIADMGEVPLLNADSYGIQIRGIDVLWRRAVIPGAHIALESFLQQRTDHSYSSDGLQKRYYTGFQISEAF